MYLESVHMGEFLTGTMEDVHKNIDLAELDNNYKNPTEVLPTPPPILCDKADCNDCESCKNYNIWKSQFDDSVDDILFRSNVHKCMGGVKQYKNKIKTSIKTKNHNKYQPVTGCLSNKWGKCKARFPRKTFASTEIDPNTGSLNIKKGEAMLNTVTAEVTYLI
jgi:hypothetical protein